MTLISRSQLRLSVGLLALALWLAAVGPALAQQAAVYQKTLEGTGFVVVPKPGNQVSYGTCWIFDHKQRLVVTNVHVVGSAEKCLVAFPRYNGGKVVTESSKYQQNDYIPGKVLARDAKRDLALVQLDRLPAGTRALALAPESIAMGSPIWGVGNSGMAQKQLNAGSLWRLRSGTVKSGVFLITSLRGTDLTLETRMINTDSGTKPGDSGGPMVDDQARLVGVTSCSNDKGDYAIDVGEVRIFLHRAMPTPSLPPPQRGIAGTWTVKWKVKDRDCYAGLTLNSDGTGQWDGSKLCPGTYTFAAGKLTLNMPGSGVQVPLKLTWQDYDRFQFTVQFNDGTIEFTATRR
jgi:S1-C subfamily serine protease